MTRQRSRYERFGKRIFDLTIAIPALVVALPFMAMLSLLIRWRLGTPVIFRQVRPGLLGKPFEVLKFRTMTDERTESGELKPDDQRIPPLGRFMRRTSLDELPQLFNVIRGEVSLVGPRPLMMEYLPLYSAEQARRHEVRPGITGWAQVNGRNSLEWEQKFAFDVWYVDHVCFRVDLKILLLTLLRVARRHGIEGAGNVKFVGSSLKSNWPKSP